MRRPLFKIARIVRRCLLPVCAILCAGIAIAWVVSYARPVRVSHLASSRFDGSHYVSRRQDVFCSSGGIHLSFDTSGGKRQLHLDSSTTFSSGPGLSRAYPTFLRDPKASGFAVGRWGFLVYSLRHGPAYMFNMIGRFPSLEELERNPERYGQLWLDRHERGVILPHWFLFVLAAAYPAAWLTRWARRRRQYRMAHGLCPNCGYDLRASKDRCPECGEAIPSRAAAEGVSA